MRGAAAFLALGLCACAALPWPSGPLRTAGTGQVDGWLDLRGSVHVHTRASHDSPGHIGDLLDAAHSAGIQWIALTEHSRHPRRAASSGRVEGITLIPGWEIGAAGGSLLALGIEDARDLPRDPPELVRAVHARGGAGLRRTPGALRPGGARAIRRPRRRRDRAREPARHGRVRCACGSRSASSSCPRASALRALLRAPRDNLERWARLPGARAIVGGVDAHAKFRALGPLGGTLDRYRDVLRLLTTHVLARNASAEEILSALRAGRSYVAFEGLGTVERFEVTAEPAGLRVHASGGAARAGVQRREDRFRAGQRGAAARAPGAAHCHVQAWLGSRLWIATSQLPAAW